MESVRHAVDRVRLQLSRFHVDVRDRLDRLSVHVVADHRHSRVADIRSGGLQFFASELIINRPRAGSSLGRFFRKVI